MLTSSESKYSTFWTKNEKITDEGDEYYFKIYNREQLGCFKVIGVQESFLVDLNDDNVVKLLYTGENEDLFQDYSDDMWFSHNANILSNYLDYTQHNTQYKNLNIKYFRHISACLQ